MLAREDHRNSSSGPQESQTLPRVPPDSKSCIHERSGEIFERITKLGYFEVGAARRDLMGWAPAKLQIASIIKSTILEVVSTLDKRPLNRTQELYDLSEEAQGNRYTVEGNIRIVALQAMHERLGKYAEWDLAENCKPLTREEFGELSAKYSVVEDPPPATVPRAAIEAKIRAAGQGELIELIEAHRPRLDYLLEDAAWMDVTWDKAREEVIDYGTWEELRFLKVHEDIREMRTHARDTFRFAAALLENYPDTRFVFVAQGADPIYEAARFLAATRPELGVRPENLVKFEAALNSEVYLRRNQRIVVVDEVVRSGNTTRQAIAALQELHQKLFRCPGNVGFEVMSFRPHLGDADKESFSPLLEELSGSPLNSIFGSRISSSLGNAATYLDHFISPRGTIETVADWRNVQIRNSPSEPFENVSAEYWLRRFELISGRARA